MFPIPRYASFDFLDFSLPGRKGGRSISIGEIRVKFREFAAPLVGIFLFTDGSRRVEDDEDSVVGAAVYSPDLHLALKHKLPSETSIFSAEAWPFIRL